jgi:hypothetical protein
MRLNLQRLLLFAVLSVAALNLSAQDAYRTNFTTAVAQWTTVASWQRFDSGTNTWVAASHFPTYLDGVITIQAGDSLQMSGPTSADVTLDQVVVEAGGILVFFNNQSGTVNLIDGPGDGDIIVNGKLYIGTSGSLTAYAKILVNDGALFTVRNTGLLARAYLVNNGTMHWGANGQNAGVFAGCAIENNNTCIWINGNTRMTGCSFINNGIMWITPTTGNIIWYGDNFDIATNNGTIVNTGGTYTVNFQIRIDNNGILGGVGTLNFANGVNTRGTISPGFSPGHLTVNSIILENATLNIEIATTGAVAGVNYDQLTVIGAASLYGLTINVTNTANDPVNTQYNIITSTTGIVNANSPYPIINVPNNFTAAFTGSALVLTKIAMLSLPVTWGKFDAVAQGNKVLLDWTTMMEQNTSHFVIEHSTNASTFTPVANIEAQENSAYESRYKYIFAGSDLSKTNYFRIKQVDLDGKHTYSATRSVRFDQGKLVTLQAYPNPVTDVLQLNIQTENVQALLTDLSGKTIQQLTLQPGQHSLNMQSLPKGIYQLSFFIKGVRVETKKIIKQ